MGRLKPVNLAILVTDRFFFSFNSFTFWIKVWLITDFLLVCVPFRWIARILCFWRSFCWLFSNSAMSYENFVVSWFLGLELFLFKNIITNNFNPTILKKSCVILFIKKVDSFWLHKVLSSPVLNIQCSCYIRFSIFSSFKRLVLMAR